MSVLQHDRSDDYVAFCEGVRTLAEVDLLQYKRPDGAAHPVVRGPRGIRDLAEYLQLLRTDATSSTSSSTGRRSTSPSSGAPRAVEMLAEHILPVLAEAGRIRAWSAGCSYGAEAFTFAAVALTAVPGTRLRSAAPTSTRA